MTTKIEPTVCRSGWCNLSFPIGHRSHDRCTKPGCPCACHQVVAASTPFEVAPSSTPLEDLAAAVEALEGPCRCWGAVGVIVPHEGHCCMTQEATDDGCHQDAGVAEYEASRKAAGLC